MVRQTQRKASRGLGGWEPPGRRMGWPHPWGGGRGRSELPPMMQEILGMHEVLGMQEVLRMQEILGMQQVLRMQEVLRMQGTSQ